MLHIMVTGRCLCGVLACFWCWPSTECHLVGTCTYRLPKWSWGTERVLFCTNMVWYWMHPNPFNEVAIFDIHAVQEQEATETTSLAP